MGASMKSNVTSEIPCSSFESESRNVQTCCVLFDRLFRSENTRTIMSIMKYSLDLSNPWISRYYQQQKDGQERPKHIAARDLYRIWLAEEDNEMVRMISNSGEPNALSSLGYAL